MSDTAFTARVTMHSAAWGDETGSVVTFKLPMSKDTEDERNPFHGFTKRRKGRAGTRFMMVCLLGVGDTRQPLYQDEVMLAGWNDSQQNGHTAKFWICNDGMGHPFEGVSRKSDLMLSLVELDDDNEAIDQKMRERVEKQVKYPSERLSYVAAMLCKNPSFWEFINEETKQSEDFLTKAVANEADAKEWIYQRCGILSRAELDLGGQAAVTFDGIRKAFTEVLEVC